MYACTECRRVLRWAVRDSLCGRCLTARDRGEFDDDAVTLPGIVPRDLRPTPR